jgi:hypothetical protein
MYGERHTQAGHLAAAKPIPGIPSSSQPTTIRDCGMWRQCHDASIFNNRILPNPGLVVERQFARAAWPNHNQNSRTSPYEILSEKWKRTDSRTNSCPSAMPHGGTRSVASCRYPSVMKYGGRKYGDAVPPRRMIPHGDQMKFTKSLSVHGEMKLGQA